MKTVIHIAAPLIALSLAASVAFAQQAGDTVTVRRYEPLYHEMFLEPEREQVLDDIVRWLLNAHG